MAEDSVEKSLDLLGWRQGSLLPLLSFNFDFDESFPETPISQASIKAGTSTKVQPPNGVPPHGVASGLPSSKTKDRWLIIISQTCDLAKPATAEPYALAAYAFLTSHDRIITAAQRDSTNQFALNIDSGLIVDCRTVVVIEKGFLRTLRPTDPGASEEQIRRFARWLGNRFSRPAHPDIFVGSVGHPIRDLFRELRDKNDDLAAVFSGLRQLRVNIPSDDKPFDVSLYLVLDDKYTDAIPEDLEVRIAELCGRVEARVTNISRFRWYALTLEQMSAKVWLDTDRLFLEDLTYTPAGEHGAAPP